MEVLFAEPERDRDHDGSDHCEDERDGHELDPELAAFRRGSLLSISHDDALLGIGRDGVAGARIDDRIVASIAATATEGARHEGEGDDDIPKTAGPHDNSLTLALLLQRPQTGQVPVGKPNGPQPG